MHAGGVIDVGIWWFVLHVHAAGAYDLTHPDQDKYNIDAVPEQSFGGFGDAAGAHDEMLPDDWASGPAAIQGNLVWEKCSRGDAVNALTAKADGTFLVRISSRGGYAFRAVQFHPNGGQIDFLFALRT